MENAIYIGLSRQTALLRQLDVIANNVANANTTAFKSGQLVFKEYLVDAGDGSKISYVQDVGITRDLREGTLKPTGNALDLAISGDGYFVLQGRSGPLYTRNGHFRLDETGRLTAANGKPVLDIDDNEIVVPPGTDAITISGDGTLSAGADSVFVLQLVSFTNPQGLKSIGDGQYSSTEDPEPATDAKVLQQMLESSNVQPIIEMTNMIQVQRAYQASSRLTQSDHDLQRRAVDRIGRVT